MPLPCPFNKDAWDEYSQDYGACVRLPVRLFARPEALMAAASAAAQPYWTAEHVRDAIAHLVADQSPLVGLGHPDSPHFPLDMIVFTEDPDAIAASMRAIGIDPDQGWDVGLLALILHGPADGGDLPFSMCPDEGPTTHHARLHDTALALAALTPAPSGGAQPGGAVTPCPAAHGATSRPPHISSTGSPMPTSSLQHIELALPVRLHADPQALMAAAAIVGPENGLDDDWIPPSITEAIYELVLAGDARVSVGDSDTPHFPLWVSFYIHGADNLREGLANHGIPLADGLDRALLAAIMLPASPVDMGFEIKELLLPNTAHAQAQSWAAAVDAFTPA